MRHDAEGARKREKPEVLNGTLSLQSDTEDRLNELITEVYRTLVVSMAQSMNCSVLRALERFWQNLVQKRKGFLACRKF